MKHLYRLSFFLLLAAGCAGPGEEAPDSGNNTDYGNLVPQEVTLQGKFTEDFSGEISEPLEFVYRTTREDFRFFSMEQIRQETVKILFPSVSCQYFPVISGFSDK